jgi:hypothetical protein
MRKFVNAPCAIPKSFLTLSRVQAGELLVLDEVVGQQLVDQVEVAVVDRLVVHAGQDVLVGHAPSSGRVRANLPCRGPPCEPGAWV